MLYSDAWGKLIHEKNQKSKISWHFPFLGLNISAVIYATKVNLAINISYRYAYSTVQYMVQYLASLPDLPYLFGFCTSCNKIK